MKLPALDDPPRYQGLYVFDFGEWCALGYTADEIAALLESRQYAAGKVYKIHRAWPDGRMELRGVANTRFHCESGMFFSRRDLDAGRRDFETLRAAGQADPPPCRARLWLAERPLAPDGTGDLARSENLRDSNRHAGPRDPAARDALLEFATALIFPAEYEDEIGQWLTRIGFAGGDLAEGGVSHVCDFDRQEKTALERAQLWPASSRASRAAEEVLRSVRRAVQR